LRVPLPSSEQQRLRLRLVQVSLVRLEPRLRQVLVALRWLAASVQRRLRQPLQSPSH
jgi:hypothetical protein